jgi:uncharacterized protein (DUF362 family)
LKFGKVILEQSLDPSIYERVVSELHLRPPVVIKPNWGTINNFTEATVLDGVLSAINGEAVVTESYGWARTEDALNGKGIGSCKKTDLKKSDEWFLKYSGVGDMLKKHGVEYVNVTEEVWAKRTVEPATVKGLAEKYPPVLFEEMYARVPRRLFDLRGGTFLSLAKYRLNHDPIAFSLSMKNFFGMIPGPGRSKYHGDGDCYLAQTIVDMNKVYRSVFDVVGMVDGVMTASRGKTPEEAIRPETVKNRGILLGSRDCVTLDATVAAMEERDPAKISSLPSPLKHSGDGTTPRSPRRGAAASGYSSLVLEGVLLSNDADYLAVLIDDGYGPEVVSLEDLHDLATHRRRLDCDDVPHHYLLEGRPRLGLEELVDVEHTPEVAFSVDYVDVHGDEASGCLISESDEGVFDDHVTGKG